MVIAIESIILCIIFTIMVYVMSRKPINTLYNYPPKIQERVKSLDEYKDKIPTNENKVVVKICASIVFLIILFYRRDSSSSYLCHGRSHKYSLYKYIRIRSK